MSSGVELIAIERRRQVYEEGWTPEHDDNWGATATLSNAGAAYAADYAAKNSDEHESWHKIFARIARELWPFDPEWWKPTPDDPVRQLVKAGALIAAEIDQRLRQDAVDPEERKSGVE